MVRVTMCNMTICSYPLLILMLLIGCDRIAQTNESALLKQVRGETCVFDARCGSHWSWWHRLSIRHPDYRCRMHAVSCLARNKMSSPEVVRVLEEAKDDLPSPFDTGDGTIGYSVCIERALTVLDNPSEKTDFELMNACGI